MRFTHTQLKTLGVCHPADGPWSGRGRCGLRGSLVSHPRAPPPPPLPPPLPLPLPEVDSQDNPSICTRAPDSAPLSAGTSGAMAGRTGASTRGALAEFDLLGVFYVSVSRAETLGLSSLHCCLLITPAHLCYHLYVWGGKSEIKPKVPSGPGQSPGHSAPRPVSRG